MESLQYETNQLCLERTNQTLRFVDKAPKRAYPFAVYIAEKDCAQVVCWCPALGIVSTQTLGMGKVDPD